MSTKKAKVELMYKKIGVGGKTGAQRIYSDVKVMSETTLMQKVYKDFPKDKFEIEVRSIEWMS